MEVGKEAKARHEGWEDRRREGGGGRKKRERAGLRRGIGNHVAFTTMVADNGCRVDLRPRYARSNGRKKENKDKQTT